MRRSRPSVLVLSLTGLIAAGPAWAQTVPEGQSCGGLLCDVGVFGHKVQVAPAPAVSAPPPTPASGKTAVIVPVPVVTSEPKGEPPQTDRPPHKAKMKKRVAKSVSPKVIGVKAKPVATKVMAAPPSVGAPGAAPGGEAPPSPADMFPPIYR